MVTYCTPTPANKKEYIFAIGKILVQENGKRKYYKPEEIKKVHQKSKWYNGLSFSCWAMSTYSAHSDFDVNYHGTGELCDYIEMNKEMLSEIFVSVHTDWTLIPDLDIAASWLDFGDIFDGIFEGIGEFIGGILEGI